MKKRYLISSVASIAILASFSMTGCGGGSSSSDTEVGSTIVRVSDAYVLNATVKAESKIFNIHHDNGRYEIAENNVTGILSAIGGINDLNGNGIADQGEPFSPELFAPSGYKNINPFTTILLNGVSILGESDYQAIAQFAPNYDFDVVEEGLIFENGIAQATAIAAIRLSSGGNGSSVGEVELSSGSGDDSLPGTGGDNESSSSVSSAISSVTSSSSSVASSVPTSGGGVLPSAVSLRGVLPSDDGDSASPVNSSSSQVNSSSLASSSSLSSSSQSSIAQSSSSSSSLAPEVTNTLAEAIAKIKAAQSANELNLILEDYMGTYNGSYIPENTESSQEAQSSSSQESEQSSSSSVINTTDDCLPGFECESTSSSSIAGISSSSESSESVSSIAQTGSNQEICEANGNTWSAEINQCLSAPTSSSSSSRAPAPSNPGSVLPF